jgi:hypothetical protein
VRENTDPARALYQVHRQQALGSDGDGAIVTPGRR